MFTGRRTELSQVANLQASTGTVVLNAIGGMAGVGTPNPGF
jgi:hypothetical protein